MSLHDDRDPRILRIVDLLLSRTRGGAITWEPDEHGSDAVYTYRSSSAISIASKDNDQTQPYVLSFYDEKGTLVESFISDPGNGLTEPLQTLFTEARRAASNIGDFLNSVIRDLEDDPPF